MSPQPLPEPVQHTVLPGWPVPVDAALPVTAVPRRVVGYEQYAGMLVPVYEAPPAPVQPQQPAPRAGMDPRAQLMLAAGAGTGMAGAGIGWGLGQAAAGLSSGGGVLLLCLLAAWRLSSVRGARGGTTTYNVTNHNRWWGRSSTNASTRT